MPSGTFYMLEKKITANELKPGEKAAFNATIAKHNNTVGTEFEVIPGPASEASEFVYAENYKNGKAAMIPKRLLDSHFVKEKGHTTETRGTALGKRKRKKRNRTMRKKHRRSRKHGRKSRKHHRGRH